VHHVCVPPRFQKVFLWCLPLVPKTAHGSPWAGVMGHGGGTTGCTVQKGYIQLTASFPEGGGHDL
jgi:hypothetical protein